MNKTLAVFKREYLQAVKKKMFIIMTVLMPFLMAAVMVLPTLLISKGLGEKRVAVVDGTGVLRESVEHPASRLAEDDDSGAKSESGKALMKSQKKNKMMGDLAVEYVDATGVQDPKAKAKPYFDRLEASDKTSKLDGVLVIPGDVISNEKSKLTYYSRSSTDLIVQERLGRMVNRGIQQRRFVQRGINPAEIEQLMHDSPLQQRQITKAGEKTGGDMNFIIAFVFIALLIIPVFIYGVEIMRGIVQEKSDRVVEVLISSMSPRELLTGKILGLAAVGLTQLTVWVLMGGIVGAYVGTMAAAATSFNVLQFLQPMMFVWFLLFFLLAYLTYVSVYAIGGAACNSEKEAQQMTMPIIMVLSIPWFVMMPIILNPDSAMAVGLSMSPLFAPMTMFARVLVSDPPAIQIAISIAVSVLTVAFLLWVTAKVFRVAILSYGKRPTIPELWRWTKVA
jgi:ABC-2 type transport system permease protein